MYDINPSTALPLLSAILTLGNLFKLCDIFQLFDAVAWLNSKNLSEIRLETPVAASAIESKAGVPLLPTCVRFNKKASVKLVIDVTI